MPHGRRTLISISLGLIVFMTAFIVTDAMLSLSEARKLQLANSGFVSDRAISIEIIEDIPISGKEVLSRLSKATYLFRKSSDLQEVIEFYAIQDGSTFPVLSGTQFNMNIKDQNVTQVIAGKESTYRPVDSIQVGQLGIKEPSLLDYQAMVLPAMHQRTLLQAGIWICDGQGDINQSVEQLCKLLGDRCVPTVSTTGGLYRMISSSRVFYSILYTVFCCCVLSTISLMIHWIDACSYEQECYERIGLSQIHQWIMFFKQMILITLPAWLLGLLCTAILLRIDWHQYVNSLFCETIIALFALVILHIIVFVTNKPQYPWNEV